MGAVSEVEQPRFFKGGKAKSGMKRRTGGKGQVTGESCGEEEPVEVMCYRNDPEFRVDFF